MATTDTLHRAAKGLVSAFVDAEGPNVLLGLYHEMVEALVHPYNRDAVEAVQKAVGTARLLREKHGHGVKNEGAARVILDSEAVLAHLGIEPIILPEAELDAAVAQMVDQAAEFLRTHIPAEAFEEAEKAMGKAAGLPN